VTGFGSFGSFGNSSAREFWICWSRLVMKIFAVVELGVNNGSGDGGSCFGIKVWIDTAKLTDMVIARFGDR